MERARAGAYSKLDEQLRALAGATGDLSTLGRSLQGAIDAYNRAVGSFDYRVLPMARRPSSTRRRDSRAVTSPTEARTAAGGTA